MNEIAIQFFIWFFGSVIACFVWGVEEGLCASGMIAFGSIIILCIVRIFDERRKKVIEKIEKDMGNITGN